MLADSALRIDPFDPIKYIPLGSDPQTYLSLGLTIRERFESLSFFMPPVVQPDNYLLDRVQLHADLHLGPHVRIFTQAIDARAPWKAVLGPIDQDKLDLEQAFVEFNFPAGDGELNIKVGRLEPFFDMQRFAAIQEGPNVWQPFDSAEVGYSRNDWRAVAFYARPVLTRDVHLFDDASINGFTLSGARVERRNFGSGKLAFFAAQLRNGNAFYLAAAGHERRDIFDMHYAGRAAGWDWDVEGMGQWAALERRRFVRGEPAAFSATRGHRGRGRRELGFSLTPPRAPIIRKETLWEPSTRCFRMDFTRCFPAILAMPISCTCDCR